MKSFLKQYPEINAVICGTDEVALGVLQAVNEAGRKDIYIYGADGCPEAKEEIAKKEVHLWEQEHSHRLISEKMLQKQLWQYWKIKIMKKRYERKHLSLIKIM